MELKTKEEYGVIIAAVRGRIEEASDAERLRIALDEAVKPSARALFLDLEELAYINSTGLRTIAYMINRTREVKMRFILCRPSGEVRELLELSGFDQLVDVAETFEEAKHMLPP